MRAEILGALERHLLATAARPRTVATYQRIAGLFADFMDPTSVRDASVADVERFLARPRRTGLPVAVSTRNLEVAALRNLFRGASNSDPTAGMKRTRPKKRRPPVPQLGELAAVFRAAARSPSSARDLAVLSLLYGAGLRPHELVALRIEQVDLSTRTVLELEGKGGTIYDQPFAHEVGELVRVWVGERGARAGVLFPGRDGEKPLSVRSVQRLVVRLAHVAGLAKHITPKSLRHGTGTHLTLAHEDLPVTSAFMRHARLETTLIYIEIASDAGRTAAATLGRAIPRDVLPASADFAEVLSPKLSKKGHVVPLDRQDAFDDVA